MFGGKNVKIILFKSGTSDTGKADATTAGVQTERIWYLYKDICFPITPECRKQLNDAVLGAYEQALTQSQNSMAKHHEMQQAPEGQAMDMTGM